MQNAVDYELVGFAQVRKSNLMQMCIAQRGSGNVPLEYQYRYKATQVKMSKGSWQTVETGDVVKVRADDGKPSLYGLVLSFVVRRTVQTEHFDAELIVLFTYSDVPADKRADMLKDADGLNLNKDNVLALSTHRVMIDARSIEAKQRVLFSQSDTNATDDAEGDAVVKVCVHAWDTQRGVLSHLSKAHLPVDSVVSRLLLAKHGGAFGTSAKRAASDALPAVKGKRLPRRSASRETVADKTTTVTTTTTSTTTLSQAKLVAACGAAPPPLPMPVASFDILKPETWTRHSAGINVRARPGREN